MDVSIVIPVKNGGARLKEVLEMIQKQSTSLTYEVICIDSGSSDDSIETIEQYGCGLYQTPAEEFGHGKTRNLGASYGTGEFIVFITQDALPVNEYWLDEFIQAMRMDDNIAGGFGKHLPYPDCNLPDKLMLQEHFARFGEENHIFEITEENRESYDTDEGYRQYLAFFSDNNSCLRRGVWEKIPYDDVDFSEDQFWARKILEQGYKKVYCPSAMVYHSHNYSLNSYKQRYYDEFKAVYRVYGMILSRTTREFIHGILGDTKHQCGYIHRDTTLTWIQKIKWYYYSARRNYLRYYAARKAVEYFDMSPEQQQQSDHKYSQQYKQIHQ